MLHESSTSADGEKFNCNMNDLNITYGSTPLMQFPPVDAFHPNNIINSSNDRNYDAMSSTPQESAAAAAYQQQMLSQQSWLSTSMVVPSHLVLPMASPSHLHHSYHLNVQQPSPVKPFNSTPNPSTPKPSKRRRPLGGSPGADHQSSKTPGASSPSCLPTAKSHKSSTGSPSLSPGAITLTHPEPCPTEHIYVDTPGDIPPIIDEDSSVLIKLFRKAVERLHDFSKEGASTAPPEDETPPPSSKKDGGKIEIPSSQDLQYMDCIAERETKLVVMIHHSSRLLKTINLLVPGWGSHESSYLWHSNAIFSSKSLIQLSVYLIIFEDVEFEAIQLLRDVFIKIKPSTTTTTTNVPMLEDNDDFVLKEFPKSLPQHPGLLAALIAQSSPLTITNTLIMLDNRRKQIDTSFNQLDDFQPLITAFLSSQSLHRTHQHPSLFLNGQLKSFKLSSELSTSSRSTKRKCASGGAPTSGGVAPAKPRTKKKPNVPVAAEDAPESPPPAATKPLKGASIPPPVKKDIATSAVTTTTSSANDNVLESGVSKTAAAATVLMDDESDQSDVASVASYVKEEDDSSHNDAATAPADAAFRSQVKGVYYDDSSNSLIGGVHHGMNEKPERKSQGTSR